jgi:hypothetical protein
MCTPPYCVSYESDGSAGQRPARESATASRAVDQFPRGFTPLSLGTHTRYGSNPAHQTKVHHSEAAAQWAICVQLSVPLRIPFSSTLLKMGAIDAVGSATGAGTKLQFGGLAGGM